MMEMFLLESVLGKHKEYFLTIYPQTNKCPSNLRQRLLHFRETVIGLLGLWRASPCKAILHPRNAVELAEFHSYDLSLTDVKKCRIRKFRSHRLERKSSRHIELLTSVPLLIDTHCWIWLKISPNMFLSTPKEDSAVLEGKIGLWYYHGFVHSPHSNFQTNWPIFTKIFMNVTPSEFTPGLNFNLPTIRNNIVAVPLALINLGSWYDYLTGVIIPLMLNKERPTWWHLLYYFII